MILNFPPPSNWQDFQLLTLRLVEQVCDPTTVREYGRQGQRQNGIDVYGEMFGGLHLGVQCKQMQSGKQLTLKLIQEEADEARSFLPYLDTFVVATTVPEDTALHKSVTGLNSAKTYPFKITYWSWAHFNDSLNRSSRLVEENYKAYAKAFDLKEELLELEALREAFDRPAFVDDFHHELNTADFLTALGETVLFLQTGLLRDRASQQLLRGSYPLGMLPAGECKKLRTQLLTELKSLRAVAIKHHTNGQLNVSRAPEYNARRYAVIATVNEGLATHNLLPVRPQYQL
ncbi:MAG: hypothetical protein ACT6UH_20550 [Hydrogenophaga sp.]|uniref:hypothetical protein n=1 Tax=Hydrogenophaga sp. TaxID=1904254 RepID=UPI004035B937